MPIIKCAPQANIKVLGVDTDECEREGCELNYYVLCYEKGICIINAEVEFTEIESQSCFLPKIFLRWADSMGNGCSDMQFSRSGNDALISARRLKTSAGWVPWI